MTDQGQDWDGMYRSREQVFSGEPNAVLVAEAAGITPGQALDVGCGEGADAVWLARRGWRVTAVDVSETALRRGVRSGRDVAERIAWTRADLSSTAMPAGAFELVSVQYFPLRKQDEGALDRLLATVAPGGTLLVTGHDPEDEGVDYGDYYRPDEIARRLAGWTVEVHEARPRTTPGPEGTHHTRDVVLKAIAPQQSTE
ncbi:bifunctional 2-polyprenyl-6-hydroxyphenol methylase/3-demethylubiquinol 3-O-methyltransferase UbiG [Amycolatopsis sp. FDAARGOS 1241]|uniref:class I SAM-dependent methyltransferase n=1 Tax=Amycolatopsis sp. FDAARGOS 1241 TaxID=2778070 RepID=UPI00194E0494|nr:class I SAM-dependent methyltransferase [Amycolatopsis sp. FDAARGOS 1241]QRP43187.1 class I SAM-dependent methyltransferase [Amycolatopsis sp. FDAARGOS 1241]